MRRNDGVRRQLGSTADGDGHDPLKRRDGVVGRLGIELREDRVRMFRAPPIGAKHLDGGSAQKLIRGFVAQDLTRVSRHDRQHCSGRDQSHSPTAVATPRIKRANGVPNTPSNPGPEHATSLRDTSGRALSVSPNGGSTVAKTTAGAVAAGTSRPRSVQGRQTRVWRAASGGRTHPFD